MSMNLSVSVFRYKRHGDGLCHGLAVRALALLLVFVIAPSVKASPADGVWRHPEDPVWIEVNTAAGIGVATRNDDQPETVGFQVVRELVEGDKTGTWKGEVFVPQLDSYKSVSITLPDAQTLRMTVKFVFIRRSVEWSRVDAIEATVSK